MTLASDLRDLHNAICSARGPSVFHDLGVLLVDRHQETIYGAMRLAEGLEAAARDVSALTRELESLRASVAAGEASDGYHTHRELYEYRMLYNAHAAHGWLAAGIPVVKSWRHSDGEPCFGGGWFIVTAALPTGQVSNHYRDEHWHLFDVPEVDLPPEYDGHTPAVAAERLRDSLDDGVAAARDACTCLPDRPCLGSICDECGAGVCPNGAPVKGTRWAG